ncbi:hypothetical protein [Sphingobium boeckii]|uniref:Uncharacterized protein n=1 Tax=Sphingobium boeckii TaxID=1082345 RepID=A0A7W9EDU1_9SPHN|nr:hypothetical protein [Sphingobium boeckii]MBB5684320.1 hypothetical protein [Sphingobium boeckii]
MIKTVEQIDNWLRGAEPGDSITYAKVAFLPQKAPGPLHVRGLAEAGLLALCQKRAPGSVFAYIAQRTRGGAEPKRHPRCGTRSLVAGSAESRFTMAMIADAARLGQRCPTLDEFAAALGLGNVHRVRRLLIGLEEAGEIAIDTHRIGAEAARSMTLLRSGLSTALPPLFRSCAATSPAARVAPARMADSATIGHARGAAGEADADQVLCPAPRPASPASDYGMAA